MIEKCDNISCLIFFREVVEIFVIYQCPSYKFDRLNLLEKTHLDDCIIFQTFVMFKYLSKTWYIKYIFFFQNFIVITKRL